MKKYREVKFSRNRDFCDFSKIKPPILADFALFLTKIDFSDFLENAKNYEFSKF